MIGVTIDITKDLSMKKKFREIAQEGTDIGSSTGHNFVIFLPIPILPILILEELYFIIIPSF